MLATAVGPQAKHKVPVHGAYSVTLVSIKYQKLYGEMQKCPGNKLLKEL